jgi:hypothetical protein
MEQHVANLKLRVISGEFAGQWVWILRLAAKTGVPFRDAVPWDDAELHPEKYVVSPTYTEDEGSAWKSITLESALQQQRILKQAGIETKLV